MINEQIDSYAPIDGMVRTGVRPLLLSNIRRKLFTEVKSIVGDDYSLVPHTYVLEIITIVYIASL